MEDLENLLIEKLEEFNYDAEDITSSTKLYNIGLDGLDFIETIMFLEDSLKIQISDNLLETVMAKGDILNNPISELSWDVAELIKQIKQNIV